MKIRDIKHLQWIYCRMKYVYNENENFDYMSRFREIINSIEYEIKKSTNSDDIYEKKAKLEIDKILEKASLFKLKEQCHNELKSKIENIKIQYGTSESANFDKNTWTFEMQKDYKVKAGEFVIMPKEEFENHINTK